MSIDNPTSPLDRALGAEERANERVCALEDLLQECAALLEYLSMWVAMADTSDASRDPDAEVDALLEKLHAAGEPAGVPGSAS